MNAKAPLKLDLNNLFRPALSDGPEGVEGFLGRFDETRQALNALRSTGQLAFSHAPEDIRAVSETLVLAERFRGAKNVIVFGIGGSALGAKSVHQALFGPFAALNASRPKLFVIDNVDARTHLELVQTIKDEDSVFVFVSKSGNTSETLAQYLFAKKAFPKFSKDNVAVVTDPHEGCLRALAAERGYAALGIPPGVGGRFSVFTPAGLLPLALAGADIEGLLEGALQGERLCRDAELTHNPAALLAFAWDHWFRGRGITQLAFLPYSDRLALFSDWAAQLFAESLGKKAGLSGQPPAYAPTVLKALGVTDQHSQLQLYLEGPRNKLACFVEIEAAPEANLDGPIGDDRADFLAGKTLHELLCAEKRATEEALRENARPNATITLADANAFQIGQLYQVIMNVVPYQGALLDINAYDQPAVDRIKKFTFGLMGKKGYDDFTHKLSEYPKRKEFVFP